MARGYAQSRSERIGVQTNTVQGRLLDRVLNRPTDYDAAPVESKNIGPYFEYERPSGYRSAKEPRNPNNVVIDGIGDYKNIKLKTDWKTEGDYKEQIPSSSNGEKVNKAVLEALMHLSHEKEAAFSMSEKDVKDFITNYVKSTLKDDFKPVKWEVIQY